VTGGGRGIGRAIAEAFAREGAAVGVLDLKAEIADAAAQAINAEGGRAVGISGNVAVRADVFGAVERLRDVFGPATILVNNAMWNRYGPLEHQTEEMIGRMIDVGFKGVVWGYQAVLDPMVKAGGRCNHQHRFTLRGTRDGQRHYVQRREGRGARRHTLGGGRVRTAQHPRQRDRAGTDADGWREPRSHGRRLGASPRAGADWTPG